MGKGRKLKKYFTLGLVAIALSFALSSCNTSPTTPEVDPRPSQVLSIETIVGNTQGQPLKFYGSEVDLEWNTARRISSISAPSIFISPCKSTVTPDIPEYSAPFDVRDNICRTYLDLAKTLHIPEEKRIDFVLFLASHTIDVDREYVKIICEDERAGACVTTNTNPNYIVTNGEEHLPHEAVHFFSNFFEPGYYNVSDIACVTHLRDGAFKFIVKSEEKGYDITFTTSGEYLATIIEAAANYTIFEFTPAPSYIRSAPKDIQKKIWELGEKQRNNSDLNNSDLSLLPVLVPDNLLREPHSISVNEFFDRVIKLFGGLDNFFKLSSEFNQLNNIFDGGVYSETNMQEACGITK